MTVQTVLNEFGGRLVSVEVGDKGHTIFAVFGASVTYGDDAVRAIMAAFRLRDVGSSMPAIQAQSFGISRGLLYSGIVGGEVRHEYSTIGDETKRLSFQVEKVLQISLLENEKAIMKFKEADVNTIIEDVVENFNIKVKSKGGSIESDLMATESLATVDELHFTNVIFNLLDNAVKYAKPDEPLHLVVRTRNNDDCSQLIIKIEDNGIGISKEHLKKIFEKFHRVPTGNVHNVKGFGLGLSYVNTIVKRLNGSISVRSEKEKGSEFELKFPLA
jgi:signal transduction histidine kinase